ncbi:hypothetical protein FRC09_007559, partial [Ceratobasidium sp. 395]
QEQGTQPLSCFRVQGVLHGVDSSGLLWFYYDGDDQWYQALLYASIEEALSQLAGLLQPQAASLEHTSTPSINQPRSPASVIAQTSIQESYQVTLTVVNARPCHHREDAQANIATTSAAAIGPTSNFLPTLSPSPSQDDIETWFAEYKKQHIRRDWPTLSARYQAVDMSQGDLMLSNIQVRYVREML